MSTGTDIKLLLSTDIHNALENANSPNASNYFITINDVFVFSVKVSLTAAQIRTGNSSPIMIAPTPGIGYALESISGSIKYKYNSVVFSSVGLFISSSSISQVQLGTADGYLNQNKSRFYRLIPLEDQGNSMIENQGLYVSTDVDSVAGDGTADVYVMYRKIKL